MEARQHPEHHYKLADVSELLDVSVRTLRNLIRNGKLGCVRVGRVIRVPESEINRFLDCNRVEYA